MMMLVKLKIIIIKSGNNNSGINNYNVLTDVEVFMTNQLMAQLKRMMKLEKIQQSKGMITQ